MFDSDVLQYKESQRRQLERARILNRPKAELEVFLAWQNVRRAFRFVNRGKSGDLVIHPRQMLLPPGTEKEFAVVIWENAEYSGPMKLEALEEMVRSRRPFSIRLTDGSLVPVPHPEFIWITRDGKTAIVNTQGSRIKIIDVDLVTALETGGRAIKKA